VCQAACYYAHFVSTPRHIQKYTLFCRLLFPLFDRIVSVQCLDYSAMYPSIMRAHNLCPSTWVLEPQYGSINSVAYATHEWKDDDGKSCGAKFVTSRKGVVVHLLEELTTMRKVCALRS
jgi:DNA polymerase elongation subunit (family B)